MNFLPKLSKNDDPNDKTMNGMIRSTERVLKMCESYVPAKVLKKLLPKCVGICVMSGISSSMIIKGGLATGILIGKKKVVIDDKNNEGKVHSEWDLPCACSLIGTGWGLSVGAVYQDVVIFLTDPSATLIKSGRLQVDIGGHVGMTLGVGTNVGVSYKMNNVSIAFTKGASIGASLDGSIVGIRSGVNKDFYGEEHSASDLLLNSGSIKLPKEQEHAMDGIYERMQALEDKANQGPPPAEKLSEPEKVVQELMEKAEEATQTGDKEEKAKETTQKEDKEEEISLNQVAIDAK